MPTDAALRLRPGQPSDVAAMVDIFIDAFSSNPIGRTFFPRNDPATHKFWTATLTEEIQDPTAHFHLITDSSSSSSSKTPIAFAKWVAPQLPGIPPQPMPEESAWPANQARAARFFQKLADTHSQIMSSDEHSGGGTRPHWYLEMMATHPAHQGRGAGAMLVAWGAARAEADGVEAYLDATPAGKPLYARFGFRDAVEPWAAAGLDVVGGGGGAYRHSFMVRRPGSKDTA